MKKCIQKEIIIIIKPKHPNNMLYLLGSNEALRKWDYMIIAGSFQLKTLYLKRQTSRLVRMLSSRKSGIYCYRIDTMYASSEVLKPDK